MVCTVLLELNVMDEHVDELAGSFSVMLPDTRTFEGCIDVYMTRDMDDPNKFIAVETSVPTARPVPPTRPSSIQRRNRTSTS